MIGIFVNFCEIFAQFFHKKFRSLDKFFCSKHKFVTLCRMAADAKLKQEEEAQKIEAARKEAARKLEEERKQQEAKRLEEERAKVNF